MAKNSKLQIPPQEPKLRIVGIFTLSSGRTISILADSNFTVVRAVVTDGDKGTVSNVVR